MHDRIERCKACGFSSLYLSFFRTVEQWILQSYSLFHGGILLCLGSRGKVFEISVIFGFDGKGIENPGTKRRNAK